MEVTTRFEGAIYSANAARRPARKPRTSAAPAGRKEREAAWVEGVRAGEGQALKKIYCAYYADLCGFAASYVDSQGYGREVVQEVFLGIWERRADWELRGSLKSYLFQAVRNRALNFLRTEKNRRGLKKAFKRRAPKCGLRTAEDHLCYSELSEAIEAAVEHLPSRRRQAFTLHRQHGLTYKEIADVMEITPKTVENHIGRALEALRKELSPRFPEIS